jgi:cold-inducible RNA-binding protein
MNIYVGNLAWSVTEDQLRDLFEEFGSVTSVKVILDKLTNKPRGFAFVEMSSDEEAKRAIDELNGKEFEGRALKVNESLPRDNSSRPPRSGGGHGGGSRGGFGGGGRGGFGGGNRY